MSTFPMPEASPSTLNLEAAAERLDVPESSVREWLASFNWERRYDGEGHLMLTQRDLDFLRVIKSLKEVDRSCESIVRIIQDDAPLEIAVTIVEELPPPAPEPDTVGESLAQLATLKAELRELHAPKPAKKPFWKFWAP